MDTKQFIKYSLLYGKSGSVTDSFWKRYTIRQDVYKRQVHKGLECFASEDRKGGSTDKYLLSADGKPFGKNEEVPSCRNWACCDGDLLRETF